ncbi:MULTISPECIES: MarR family transcriptional regulator [unclassified Enterococcus]|uniref:MarR family winged helix-turn-helix transcriptional regulator n=1 Tax=unclassified Enterococcus TaxID=2608891 RepID=UPI0015582227|nr:MULTISPECIES: MarR family transcriptional regulator [unclassified Enterococcus]MBS7576525.1 MarR family transcriptional regulator [Enterococcus sp. MMGLQ5-2]MBS7583988.1 MarR family transcriptional regulator [Enterococcus sp. MMGLQ5-1]NPD11849.1 MarR family transcriptional regulator [Enterococcus sp. MMGLQ5-1]NPD36362.1 MarR family transcriptional regulator [Enterococcus sp. MMGLQ5-2]
MNLKTSLIDLQCEMVAERTLVNPKNISWLQYDILYQLEKEGAILPSNLSIILGTSRTKLSKALKALKSLGYIQQLPNKLDGRELYTSITEDGKILLTNIFTNHIVLYQTALKSFDEREQEEFARLASKLSNRLREERVGNDE